MDEAMREVIWMTGPGRAELMQASIPVHFPDDERPA